MSTLVDTVKTVLYQDGQISVAMESGVEIRFPAAVIPALPKARPDNSTM
jgi:hypothetical protein